MPSYRKVKGLPVVTMAEGKKIGTIEAILVDPNAKRVNWLRIRNGGLAGHHRWIPSEAVHSLGRDVVTVNAESDVRTGPEAEQAENLAKAKRMIVGTKAVTDAGEYLGEVRDYEFAPEDLALTQVNIGTGRFGRSLTAPIDHVLTLGSDVTIVASQVTQRQEEASQTT